MKAFLQKTLPLGVVLLVIAGFATGFLSKEEASQLGRRIYYGGLNIFWSFSSSPSTHSYSDAATCRENLKLIEMAKRRAAEKSDLTIGIISQDAIVKYLPGKVLPECPSGGFYSINPLVQMPSCSIGPQDNVDPKDNHSLVEF